MITAPDPTVTRKPFGTLPDGTAVELILIETPELRLGVTSFGARVVSLECRDRDGNMADVVLGYSDVSGYVADTKCFLGCIAGRYANRLANGRFSLNHQEFEITLNDGPNALHGGVEGFDRRNWLVFDSPGGVEFALISPDGDQGFPGELSVKVAYTIEGSTVRIDYYATTSRSTVINLTNHAYFNLDGESSGTVLNHWLQLASDSYTPVNETMIPTGEIAPVAGTPFDFTMPRQIGERIEDRHEQMVRARGYDHNWVLRGEGYDMRTAAVLTAGESGRTLTVTTCEPGVQFYTGNFLAGEFTGKSGAPYAFRSGVCLETQHFPDAPNQPAFASTVLNPEEVFRSTTTWTFGIE